MPKRSKIIALAGNPNVGKSTLFNNLTGMHQHTGNWPGKTVSNVSGTYESKNFSYTIFDLPGTYSIISHSKEEEVARDFICFENPDACIVVCDATCLERNLNLVLQIMEITDNVIVCVNLMDEAKKKKIEIDLNLLEQLLNVKVVGIVARSKAGLNELIATLDTTVSGKIKNKPFQIKYSEPVEKAIAKVLESLTVLDLKFNKRWIALKLLDNDMDIINTLNKYLGKNILKEKDVMKNLSIAKKILLENNINKDNFKEEIVSNIVSNASFIAFKCVTFKDKNYNKKDRFIDHLLTSKWFGIPFMISILACILWITIVGASYPSDFLFNILFKLGNHLMHFLNFIHVPSLISEVLVSGIYRVLAWVVAVMLPPMAIFFPMFTLLEDVGILPRIAFNLDKCFKKCKACGKQALTMCMGFGCNAVGVSGARIIDSPRERLIAILTNVFVPCNGRFPMIISIITMFFIGFKVSMGSSVLSTLILTLVILVGIITTLIVSKILSNTLLKGLPSSFTLELPPYRKPQITKVIIRSIFDRTIFVLGRAIVVAIPAGLIIWLMANIKISGLSILGYCANFLDPLGKLMGLDGFILIAFILGFPANEIVVPILIMGYMATSNLTDFSNLLYLKELLINNGWTITTAVCFITFSLMHFPCSTTLLTIKKEVGTKWMILGFLIPTTVGIVMCIIINTILSLFI